MRENQQKTSSYWGSVRCFRHLIVGVVGALIVIPTTLCVVLAIQYLNLEAVATEYPPESQQSVSPADTLPPPPVLPEPETPPPPLAVETLPWQSLYPELYAQEAQRSTVDADKTVYLTFDDGPSARTPEILEILAQYDAKATFFVVGKTDEQSRQWMRDIVAGGHTIGMHTYSHNYKQIYASPEAFLADYNEIYQLIYDATGVYPQISRFPGGSINGYNGANYTDMISELVRRGFVYFDWNVATGDAAERKSVSASVLTRNALSRVNSLHRAMVLMHDSADKKTTVESLPAIIEGYLDAGFTFAALTPEVVPIIYSYPT